MLARRLASAVVAIPLLVGIIGWGADWLFVALIVVLVLTAQWELYRMFAGVGVEADAGAGFLFGVFVVLAFAGGRPWLVPLALSVAVAGSLTLGLRRTAGPEWAGVALTLTGVCYCAWLLGHAVWIRALPGGRTLMLAVLWVTWCGETAAYFVGRRWGRQKLAPWISPGKTVEGAVAQVVASLGASLVAAPLLPLAAGHTLGLAVVLGVVGQVGDLVESFLKRSAATKDAGTLVPGHGGLLDRLDSLLFNVPALYYYVNVFSAR